ncbi:MAG: glycosyltransferase, partial [Candidatus Saccharibacteria bacterium]
GTFAAKILKKRVIWTDHADLKHIWKNINIWYKNPVGKLVYSSALLADEIVAISKNEKKLICDNLGLKSSVKEKIRLIYNGSHDKIKLHTVKRNEKYTYIFAGRLVIDKGIKEIIEAFNKLSKLEKNIQLQLVGDGPDKDRFKKLAATNKDIYFLGYKTDPYKYMANADVFVYASYHEAFGVSLVEAAMLKLPIIATEVGGIPEIITDHKTGLLVKPKDSESLYKAMKELYDDRNLAKSLSISARKQFEEKFDFDIIVKNQYVPIYEKGIK